MGAKANRKKMKEQLAKKMQQSYNTKDETGMYKNFFTDALKLPNFVASKDEYMVDMLPWEAGKHDPQTEEGDYTHVLDIWTHGNVGASERTVVCPTRTYDKKCPMCEKGKKLRESAETDEEQDEAKSYNPVRRAAYQVVVRDGGKEEKKGVQLFIIAHFHMEKHLSKLSKNPKGGGFIPFALPTDEGRTVCFERTGTGAKTTGYDGHRFVDRDNDIEKKYLKKVVCLDDFIEQFEYDDLYKLFNASKPSDDDDDDDDMGDDVPLNGVEEEEVDDEDEEDGLDELSLKKLKKLYKEELGKAPKKKMDDDDMIEAIRDHRAEDEDEDEVEEEDEVDDGLDELERKELRKIYKKETGENVKKNWEDSDIADKIREARGGDEDEDEDEDEGSTPSSKKLKCPAKKGKFGEDVDTLTECDKCKIYKKCEAKYDEDDD